MKTAHITVLALLFIVVLALSFRVIGQQVNYRSEAAYPGAREDSFYPGAPEFPDPDTYPGAPEGEETDSVEAPFSEDVLTTPTE